MFGDVGTGQAVQAEHQGLPLLSVLEQTWCCQLCEGAQLQPGCGLRQMGVMQLDPRAP